MEVEDPLHVIFKCRGIDIVWRSSPFDKLTPTDFASVWNWMEKLHQSLSADEFHLAIIIAWKAWDIRNKEFKGEKGVAIMDEVVQWSRAYLDAFKLAQLPSNTQLSLPLPSVWRTPPVGVVKINFDAALHRGKNCYSVAIVARNTDGKSIGWRVDTIDGSLLAVECEAMAALAAVKMAKDFGWTSIIVEGDCLQVIQALRNKNCDCSSFGALMEDCLQIANSLESCSFVFIKRCGNRLAYALAKFLHNHCISGIDLPPKVVAIA
ncbi:PREDICTED: uncharacterized protein LOC105954520 [Erythranthe guttata]|uniref:uncharacterized protein LOC105954520 n=1 Tax=Erythranthe guttata TaxID=4155 RepID=UPI00064D865D|nr:PREDICTED: uncharacterized protein LOC105954520 [Erythranthe guttata]|eukprot:XP_012833643.1 PREDICTED: uncharacterized protein LOC105954520 [Erythranthe guttata]